MSQIVQALLLAIAILGTAALSVAGLLPTGIADWAPLALLALFPGAWLGKGRSCCGGRA